VDMVAANWFGLLAPAATPAPVRQRLGEITAALLAQDDMRARLAAAGLEPRPVGPEAFARVLDEDFRRWAEVARAANIRVR